jgi:hypothetical protein
MSNPLTESSVSNGRGTGDGESSQAPKMQMIEQVRRLAVEFLKNNCEARRVQVVKMGLADHAKGIWEIEAHAFVPNTTIQNLGLEVSKEVLDSETYTLRIDGQLNIIGFGLKSLVDD